jgi:tetratricopeptide (TPR) repeat protein
MLVDLLGQVGRTADSIGTSMENIDSKSVWLVIARALRLLIGECLVFSIGLASQTTGRPMDLPPEVSSRLAPGVSALKSGDLDTAQSIFASALRQGIKHPLVFHNLGVIEQQRGNHQRAIARFREALALQPDYAPSHLLLGSSLLALGRNVEAVRELKRAAALMPQQPQAHLQLAKAYAASDNWLAAVQEWQRLVELAPSEPEYAYQSGRAWTKLSEWSYRRILGVNPKSARLRQALGQEYAIQEKYDLALDAYKRAAVTDPNLPEIHLGIALICLQLKRFDEALENVNLELKLEPESKAAAEAKQKIEAAKTASLP